MECPISRLSERALPLHVVLGEYYRGRRDAFLKRIIVKLLAHTGSAETTIVNPACVFGRHACDLASRLPHARVIATDIDPNWARLYRLARGGRMPGNYSFVPDNIFAPHREIQPTTVVFFGACGAVSDAALSLRPAAGTASPRAFAGNSWSACLRAESLRPPAPTTLP